MPGRVLDVTAYTTLDYVEVSVHGSNWSEEGTTVLDVRTSKDDPDTVALDLELDSTAVAHVKPHAQSVSLTNEQPWRLVKAPEEAIEGDRNKRPARLRG
ncbi:DUF6360 family protein [Haladaptatus pallidirubidus]|uniref:Uncharacterized protein n=1 Tax=Haladaptatus pallidirubidus TaxID=1008152 RepID=A0AAV3UQS2_9EURY|nr:DUF6360 family protein [Haladaptatus pallidirubidus]